jgi:hypothetical protein
VSGWTVTRGKQIVSLARTVRNIAIAAALGSTAAVSAYAAGEAPLTPRTAFFGNPVKAGGQLRPDGKWVSWRAP